MIITVDKDNKVISHKKIEGISYSHKIVDYVPEDIDTHNYKYVLGRFIDLGKKEETISQEEINLDFDYRLCCLELGI